MASNNAENATIDPYVKPKPGKKPKAAVPGQPPSNIRPATSQWPQQPFGAPPADKQKLILCRYFELGQCQRGSSCWFAHGRDELRYPQKHASRQEAHAVKPPMYDQEEQEQCPDEALFKTRMCVYFQQGRCQRGSACTFAHDPAELQAYNPARRYAQQAQSSPAHTMDRYLPQRLQEEAAAASSAREAREAAAAAAKPEKNQSALRMSSPTVSSPRLSFLNESQGPAVVSVPMPLTSQPYVIPMPTSVKPNGQQASTLNDDRKAGSGGHEHSKGFKHPIESTADIGQGDSVGQIEQGLDLLNLSNLNSEEDDLEAPSSFCCPITTELLHDPVVAADGHTYERQHIAEWLQKSDTSPMTNEPMDHKHLIPNLALRAVMEAYFGAREGLTQ